MADFPPTPGPLRTTLKNKVPLRPRQKTSWFDRENAKNPIPSPFCSFFIFLRDKSTEEKVTCKLQNKNNYFAGSDCVLTAGKMQ